MKNINDFIPSVMEDAEALIANHSCFANLSIPGNLTFTTSSKMSRALGKCCRRRSRYGGLDKFIIVISEMVLQDQVADFLVENVIMHELLHAIDRNENGHKGRWALLASYVNRDYPDRYNITRCEDQENLKAANYTEVEAKYTICCTKCDNKIKRNRASNLTKHPEWYRCKCGGTLEVLTKKPHIEVKVAACEVPDLPSIKLNNEVSGQVSMIFD